MKTIRYFTEPVMQKRSYLREEWIEMTLNHPDYKEVQDNNRIRHWKYIKEIGKYIRVVTLRDGETVHNAFPDRNFKGAKNEV